MKRFHYIISVLIPLLWITSVTHTYGAEQSDKELIQQKVKSAVKEVLQIMRKEDLKTMEKKKKAEEIAAPMFNYRLMSMLTIGQETWKKMNQEQQKMFVELFKDVIQNSYFDNIRRITNQSVDYKEPRREGAKKFRMQTFVNMKNEKMEVIYKFYHGSEDADWKIYDVVVSGVSIVQSFGSQYEEFLQQHTIPELFDKMRKKIQNLHEKFKNES